MIVAFDPGNTTGYFCFNDDGTDSDFGQLSGEEELIDFLTQLKDVSLIILEKYTLYGHKAMAQTGSNMITPQRIGMIKMYARQKNVPVVEQPANILPVAEMWSQVKVEGKGGHAQSHWKSAYNHGFYYLVKMGKRKTKLQEAGNV